MSSQFEQTSSEELFRGRLTSVHKRTFRHEDGEEVEREVIEHSGAVGIVAHDGESVWLVRQPREAVGVPDLLELPAGKLDVEGEPPLEAGKRELAEEIGKAAATWVPLCRFYSSPGLLSEEVHLFLATDLSDVARPEVDEDERIEIVSHPLSRLDDLLGMVADSKTLIGLYELRRRLDGPEA